MQHTSVVKNEVDEETDQDNDETKLSGRPTRKAPKRHLFSKQEEDDDEDEDDYDNFDDDSGHKGIKGKRSAKSSSKKPKKSSNSNNGSIVKDIAEPETSMEQDEEDEVESGSHFSFEAGHLIQLYMENFMCHRKFTLNFGRHLNFISGKNGSGG